MVLILLLNIISSEYVIFWAAPSPLGTLESQISNLNKGFTPFWRVFSSLNNGVTHFPSYLKKFTGNRLRKSHYDNLSIISEITPSIPQNLTSANTHTSGIGKSFFYRAHLIWNRLPYNLRAIESASFFRSKVLKHLWGEILTSIIDVDEEALK